MYVRFWLWTSVMKLILAVALVGALVTGWSGWKPWARRISFGLSVWRVVEEVVRHLEQRGRRPPL